MTICAGFPHWSIKLIFSVIYFSLTPTVNAAGTLRLVQSLFRHGDRNPAAVFPTDTGNLEPTWKEGFGELTERGMREQYELGKYLKTLYKDFLGAHYDAREVHVRSTGYNRTIMSALSNLAGMYPPVGDDIWNKDLLWQPIPVHSRPRELDYMLWMDKPCPTVATLYKNNVEISEPYLKIEHENADFLLFLKEKTGFPSVGLKELWLIYDPLYCENEHNKTHTWPAWVNQSVFDRVVELHRLSTTFYYNLPEIKRLRGGTLFHEIAARMHEKAKNQSAYISRLKYFAYSAHDTTQEALLENLNVYDGSIPPYNQLLLFELHEIEQNFVVKLFKKNETSVDPMEIVIPSCQPCTVDKFLELAQLNKPEDWNKECGLPDGSSPSNVQEITAILVAVSILFFVLFLIVLAFYCKLRKTTSSWTNMSL